MTHMKTVTLRQMQHNLSEIVRQIDHGEEIVVTRRGRPMARLVPIIPQKTRAEWPDFAARAVRAKRSLSDVIIEERNSP